MIDADVLDESIQQMVKDMKATQHGDRTNKFYDLINDYHIEGGVWKHTKLAIEALPEIAKGLDSATKTDTYSKLFDTYKNQLRSAALYHDIGKIATQEPSSSRKGSYTFPEHSKEKIVKELFVKYGVTPDPIVSELIAGHHLSPADVTNALSAGTLDQEKVDLLMILKGADNMAVGPKGSHSAVSHVAKFMDAMKSIEAEDLTQTLKWDIDDIEWSEEHELGFIEPTKDPTNTASSGTANLVVTVSSNPYEGNFTADMRKEGSKDEFELAIDFLRKDVYSFLENQPNAPDDVRNSVSLEVVPEQSFDINDELNNRMTFDIVLNVNW